MRDMCRGDFGAVLERQERSPACYSKNAEHPENRKLKPLPPDPFRHQDSAIAQHDLDNEYPRTQLVTRISQRGIRYEPDL
jgi:hypothetical protein